MALEEYRRKREFSRTPEPRGKASKRGKKARQLAFVIQQHHASQLHYDFRLEAGGVLVSWAVPKGPSLDPAEKRLAVKVEDHPLEYGNFEGVIPAGQYGGGTVLLWDRGAWRTQAEHDDPVKAIAAGKLKFELQGEKLQGGWTLVRMKPRAGEKDNNWLLIKERDDTAQPLAEYDVLDAEPRSVASGRTLAQIATQRDRVWKSNRKEPQTKAGATKRKVAKKAARKPRKKAKTKAKTAGKSKRAGKSKEEPPLDVALLKNAPQAKLPATLEPQLATSEKQAPSGAQWCHEIKFDGYRMLCRLEDGRPRFLTRNGNDWTERLSTLAGALSNLPVEQALLDGEVVALEPDGRSSFELLQQTLSQARPKGLTYYAFDLLHVDGRDTRGLPLERRKELLRQLVEPTAGPNDATSAMEKPRARGGALRYSEHLLGDGQNIFEQACRLGTEGIISKRLDRPYRSGRGRDWLKIKCLAGEEFVIVGYTKGAGRLEFGALLLGYYDGGKLLYAGRVGTGFSELTLAELGARLRALHERNSPLDERPAGLPRKGLQWVRPELVAQVEYSNWTTAGILRHPRFRGLREDKPASQVVRERPGGKGRQAGKIASTLPNNLPDSLRKVRVTNPDRVLYPEDGLTKLDLLTYYTQVAEWMLPHIANRPLALVRCPEGHTNPCFYQKHELPGLPPAVRRVPIDEADKRENHLAIDDITGLLTLVQFGVLEFHQWGSRADDVERPDRLVFDLDPDPSVGWPRVIEAAIELRAFLDELGLITFVKTTGGKGLHLVAPLTRRHDWDTVKPACKAIAEQFSAAHRGKFTTNVSKNARQGKIYVDYLRNGRGATAVAAYSTRARAGAAVSMPVTWDELPKIKQPDAFRVDNTPRHLAQRKADPWAELAAVRQSLNKKLLSRLGV